MRHAASIHNNCLVALRSFAIYYVALRSFAAFDWDANTPVLRLAVCNTAHVAAMCVVRRVLCAAQIKD